MATDREELEALRRLAELEARAGAASPIAQNQPQLGMQPAQGRARPTLGQFSPVGIIGEGLSRLGLPAVSEFNAAAQQHSMNALHGLAQLGVRGLEAAGIAPRGTSASDQAALSQREADYQARVPDSAASYAGAAVGEVAPWLVGIGAARGAGLLPQLRPLAQTTGLLGKTGGVAARGGLLAGEGALAGAATPVLEADDFGGAKLEQIGVGAALAPVAALGVRGVTGTLGAARQGARYLTPGGREALANQQLLQQFGSDPATLAALRQQSPVAGFQLSPAQALGTPEAVQSERILRNQRDTAPLFAALEGQQNVALRNQVSGLAGGATEAERAAAEAAARQARTQATAPVFGQLPGVQVDPLPVLTAVDTLQRSGLGTNKTVREALTGLQAEIRSRIENGTLSADVLSGLRENIGSYLGPTATAQEKKALAPIRDSIVDALDAAVPGYRANLATYARLSAPIKGMAVGRELLDAIDNSRLDAAGNPTVDLTKVRSALAKAKKSKNPPDKATLQQLESAIEAIQKRGISANTVAAAGPGTAADILRDIQGGLLQRTIRSVPFVGPPAEALLGAIPADISRRAGRKAVRAQDTAAAIEAARRAQTPGSLLPQYNLPAYLLPYRER